MSIDDYRPHFMVEAVYDLKPDQLREHGIRAVLVDLDNTLIAWNNPDGTPELRAWLDEMTEADIPVVVVSNNKHERVERAVANFHVDFVSRAMKPFTKGINEAIERYHFNCFPGERSPSSSVARCRKLRLPRRWAASCG